MFVSLCSSIKCLSLTMLLDFIEYERNTFIPMRASDPPMGSPPNAYELLKIEIEFFIQVYVDTNGKLPSNDAVQLEACRIVYAAEVAADVDLQETPLTKKCSWLRDLIMSSIALATQARFSPIRMVSECRHHTLKANGKDHLFEDCPLEEQLRGFVLGRQLLGETVTDIQLQTEMCEIVRQLEATSITPSDMFANWIVKGIYSNPEWLSSFKQRAGVLDGSQAAGYPMDMRAQQVPSEWAHVIQSPTSYFDLDVLFPSEPSPLNFPPQVSSEDHATISSSRATMFNRNGKPTVLLPDDVNFHRVFESDMKRWAAATMSPKNPNCHVPSDEEIQHQGRWIMYNGDDPCDQTPADFEAWLWRFKRDVGILNDVQVVDPAELSRHR